MQYLVNWQTNTREKALIKDKDLYICHFKKLYCFWWLLIFTQSKWLFFSFFYQKYLIKLHPGKLFCIKLYCFVFLRILTLAHRVWDIYCDDMKYCKNPQSGPCCTWQKVNERIPDRGDCTWTYLYICTWHACKWYYQDKKAFLYMKIKNKNWINLYKFIYLLTLSEHHRHSLVMCV